MESNNNPPFAEDQRIIRIGPTKSSKAGLATFVRGKVYTCAECYKCECGKWKVKIKEFPSFGNAKIATCVCGFKQHSEYYIGFAALFAPIQETYADITNEIAESMKETKERPDKVLIPETVNN